MGNYKKYLGGETKNGRVHHPDECLGRGWYRNLTAGQYELSKSCKRPVRDKAVTGDRFPFTVRFPSEWKLEILKEYKNSNGYLYKLDKVKPLEKPELKIGFAIWGFKDGVRFRTDTLTVFIEGEKYYDWHDADAGYDVKGRTGISYRAGMPIFRTKEQAVKFAEENCRLQNKIFDSIEIEPVTYLGYITSGLIEDYVVDIVDRVTPL